MSTMIISCILVYIVYRIVRSLYKAKATGCGESCSGCNACIHATNIYQEYKKDHPHK